MKGFLRKIVIMLYKLSRINKHTVIIVDGSYPSGSNAYAIYKQKEKLEKLGYSITYISKDKLSIKKPTLKNYFKYATNLLSLSRYEYIITTHGFPNYDDKQTVIEFWHGIPLKSMLKMETDERESQKAYLKPDFLITSSKMHSVLMSATHHIPYLSHQVLGSPRNDLLLVNNKEVTKPERFSKYKHIIIYMPTFRKGYANRVEGYDFGTLFNIESFNLDAFSSFLEENKILLITKYHPKEETLLLEQIERSENIFNLTNQDLKANNLDLYEVLKFTDMLITDYSSIYFDYLLLNKPIIFVKSDLDQYRDTRGLLLEPYDYWTPGPKVVTQKDLEHEIKKHLKNPSLYEERRKEFIDIFHAYDGKDNVERFIDFFQSL